MWRTVIRKAACCSGRNGRKGSVTLEASIVFPVFLAFMLLLINFIKIGLVYMAVSHAVSEAAKQVATHAYPLSHVKQGTDNLAEKIGISPIASLETDTAQKLLDTVREDVSQEVLDIVLKEISSSKIQDYLPGGLIDEDQIDIEVKMCNPWAGEYQRYTINDVELNREDIAIVASYRVPLLFPFAGGREVSLTSVSVERAWLR